MSATSYASYLIDTNGYLYAAGHNQYGQLGNTTNNSSTTPNYTFMKQATLVKVKQVSPGNMHSMILLDNGAAYSCGLNNYGQLGVSTNSGTTTVNPAPLSLAFASSVKQVSCGYYHSAVLLDDGSVYLAGYNLYGQLGRATNSGTSTANPTLTKVTGLGVVKQVACGAHHTVVVLDDGTVYACGNNHYGQLGNASNNGADVANATFTQISGITNVKSAACGYYSTVLLMNDGTIWTAGYNIAGQLCRSTNSGTSTPVPTFAQVTGINNIRQVACGAYHTVLLLGDASVYAAGYNIYGQLGVPTNSGVATSNYTPLKITSVTNAKSISCGWNHTLVELLDGSVYSFGINQYGQLGTATNSGTNTANNVPTLIQSIPTIRTLADVPTAVIRISFTDVDPTRVYSSPNSNCTIRYRIDPVSYSQTTVHTFDSADAANFEANSYAMFNGVLAPINDYNASMGLDGTTTNGKIWRSPIDITNLRGITKVEVLK